jgi:ABC-type oligopeptide transport system substrate-binding subunit
MKFNIASVKRPRAKKALGLLAVALTACLLAACSTNHNSSTNTTQTAAKSGSKTPQKQPSQVVLTLADTGHKVTLNPGSSLTVKLPDTKSSSDRWQLLTSGPGVKETNGGEYGSLTGSKQPTQSFDFKWDRSTPFGMVMILQSQKHKVLEPEEFAVTLVPEGYSIK